MSTDLEREIRETLRERVGKMRAPMEIPRSVRGRARRRRIGTAIGSSLVVAGLVAGIVVGVRALLAPGPPPAVKLGGPDAFAVWPQTTREEARQAQDCVDAGRAECIWQLNALEVVRRYGQQELGWENVFAYVRGFSDEYLLLPLEGEVDIGLVDVVDPLTVRITECHPPQVDARGCRTAHLTVEKPLVPDVRGIWLITHSKEGTLYVEEASPALPPLTAPVLDFVQRFMDRRHAGSGAERFLSDAALAQYERGEGNLSLYGYVQDSTYDISGQTMGGGGPDGYLVEIRIRVGELTIDEQLLVETRPDGDETGPSAKDFVIVAADRIE